MTLSHILTDFSRLDYHIPLPPQPSRKTSKANQTYPDQPLLLEGATNSNIVRDPAESESKETAGVK